MSESPFNQQDQNPFDDSDSQNAPASTNARPSERPTSVTVFGILNIVFGILGVCGTAFGLVSIFAQEALQPPGAPVNPVQEAMNASDGYQAFLIGASAVGMVATIALIISGAGLLNGKLYGRTLSIWYAIYGIISVIVGLIANIVFVFGPVFEQLDQMPDGPEKIGATAGLYGGVFGSCIGMIYPVLLLIFMKRRNVVTYFQQVNGTASS